MRTFLCAVMLFATLTLINTPTYACKGGKGGGLFGGGRGRQMAFRSMPCAVPIAYYNLPPTAPQPYPYTPQPTGYPAPAYYNQPVDYNQGYTYMGGYTQTTQGPALVPQATQFVPRNAPTVPQPKPAPTLPPAPAFKSAPIAPQAPEQP
jgi:hypothetical protein